MAKKTKREIMNLERLTSNIFNEFKKQTSIIKTEYSNHIYLRLPFRLPDDREITITLEEKEDKYFLTENSLIGYLLNYGITKKNKHFLKCAERAMEHYEFKLHDNWTFKKEIYPEKNNIGEDVFKFATGLQQIAYSVLNTIAK